MTRRSNTSARLAFSIAAAFIMVLCLTVTTFAIVYSMVSVESNLFTTGIIRINLNDGIPIVNQNEGLLEPGATVKRDFFVENESTCDVYYRVYFKNVSGGLADVLTVRLCDGDDVLFEGTPEAFTRNRVSAANEPLDIGEKRELQLYFHFPTTAGNAAQEQSLAFDLVAEAVQTKNNSEKLFG